MIKSIKDDQKISKASKTSKPSPESTSNDLMKS
jgi:hypothetical protein